MASIGDTSDGRHRAATEPRKPGRDTLTPASAQRATRFTRIVHAVVIDIGIGIGFLAGAPTNSATYRAMIAALAPLLDNLSGMWPWGVLLVIAGLLIPFGQIAVGAPLGAFVWSVFAVFNVLSLSSGAWAAPIFVGLALMHCGMGWYIVRDRVRAATAQRAGRRA